MTEEKIIKVSKEDQDKWMQLAADIHKIIMSEIDSVKDSESLYQVYPSLTICYEFFCMLRGDGFDASRPPGIDSRKLYQMEDEIKDRLKELSKKLDPNDEKVKHYLDETRNWIKIYE